jgi:hypothetical protein
MNCTAGETEGWVSTQRFMRTTPAAQAMLDTSDKMKLYAKLSVAAHRAKDT